MAAVDEHGELDLGRAAVIGKGVERGADGTAGEKHVVHEDDVRAVHGEGNVAFLDGGVFAEVLEVVAIERNIEHAEREFPAILLGKQRQNPLRHFIAAAADADERDGMAAVFLADRPGEAFHAGGDVFCGEGVFHGIKN